MPASNPMLPGPGPTSGRRRGPAPGFGFDFETTSGRTDSAKPAGRAERFPVTGEPSPSRHCFASHHRCCNVAARSLYRTCPVALTGIRFPVRYAVATPAFFFQEVAPLTAWFTASIFFTPSTESQSSRAFSPFSP